MDKKIRVRFAPSPTGGLHLGGVRTVLYNYLFAKKQGGDFILRIEDTDQTRFVEGAEQYIYDCLDWCGLTPDESPLFGGPHTPYRQSERKYLYYQYAQQLVDAGYAYYAFDTPEELEQERNKATNNGGANFQYDHGTRMRMKNSLTLSAEKVIELLNNHTPYVIRIKVPMNETVKFTDMVRGDVSFDTNMVDDKVLLKADGMPTYHLAVVVDDYRMNITHAFRGEEWLPSAPVHVLLWQYLGLQEQMPQWAHLPLILKPDGHGKLSKRDGDRLGFPVFAMNWKDPKTGELVQGFRERGFLPEAFLNMLAMLGWNDGTEQEIFTLNEMIARFSMERVHKGGAKFDYEKAKWFNHQHMQRKSDSELAALIQPFFEQQGVNASLEDLATIAVLIKDRCSLLSDFWDQGYYFFITPEISELSAIQEKWDDRKKDFFTNWTSDLSSLSSWTHTDIEQSFTAALAQAALKKGELMLPLRIMLVGSKFGPGVFTIAEIIGKQETVKRIQNALKML